MKQSHLISDFNLSNKSEWLIYNKNENTMNLKTSYKIKII